MAIEKGKLQLEKWAYLKFQKAFKAGAFSGQRYGQAFYHHFNLHKLADQTQLKGLYEKDGEAAIGTISEVFRFN
jgi:hypothetical protein